MKAAPVACSLVLALGLSPGAITRDAPIDRFTANGLNIGADANRPAAVLVEIDIDRWSTAAERNQLGTLLAKNRQDAAVGLLTDLARAGTIRTPQLGGDPVYYASRTIAADKSERIVLLAARPIRSFESSFKAGMSSYPFSVVDLRLGPDGRGSGTVILGARLTSELAPDADRVVQPVRLTDVKRVPLRELTSYQPGSTNTSHVTMGAVRTITPPQASRPR